MNKPPPVAVALAEFGAVVIPTLFAKQNGNKKSPEGL
jgi:hypothetical protein